MPSFWRWFFIGSSGSEGSAFPGYKCIANSWLLLHAIIATMLTVFSDKTLTTTATIMGALVSGALLSIVLRLGSNFHDLQKSEEIKQLMDLHTGGYIYYSYSYLLSLYIILLTITSWVIAATGIFTYNSSLFEISLYSFSFQFVLFFLSSMSLRTAWSFAQIVQSLTIARRQIEIVLSQPTTSKQTNKKS